MVPGPARESPWGSGKILKIRLSRDLGDASDAFHTWQMMKMVVIMIRRIIHLISINLYPFLRVAISPATFELYDSSTNPDALHCTLIGPLSN